MKIIFALLILLVLFACQNEHKEIKVKPYTKEDMDKGCYIEIDTSIQIDTTLISIRGTVIDYYSKKRIEGVSFYYDNNNPNDALCVSNKDGKFEYHDCGGQRLYIKKKGYCNSEAQLNKFAPGQIVEMTVYLSKLAQ